MASGIAVTPWGGAGTATTTPAATKPKGNTGGVNDIPQPGVNALGDIGTQVLPGQTGPLSSPPKLRTNTAQRAAASEAITAQELLTLYQHAFGDGQMDRTDIANLGKLDNRDLAKSLQKYGTNPIPTAGGRQSATDTINHLKDQLTDQIVLYVPGLTQQQIKATDPKRIMGLPVSKSLSQLFGQDGYNIPEGTPIGAAIDTVDPTKILKGKTNEQIAPAVSGQLTATQAYNAFVGTYNSSDANQKKILTQQLVNARVMDTLNPSSQDIETAYAKLIRQSVSSGTSVADILTTNPTSSTQASEIVSAASKLGVSLNQQQEANLVKQATAASTPWTTSQISQAVAQEFQFTSPDSLSGDAALLYQGIKKIADEYQIPLSDGTAGQWVTNAIKGVDYGDPTQDATSFAQGTSATQASFLQYAQNQAISMYPQFTTQIKNGMNTKTLLEPYAEVAASVLGYGSVSGTGNSVSAAATGDAISSLGINWSQPKWSKALQGGRDPASGQAVPMSLDQWRANLITDPQYGWQHTDDAKNAAMAVSDHLLSVFGQPAAQGQ
jgi:hypothetical protein